MKRLLRFLRLRPADQWLVVEAAVMVSVAGILLRVFGFPRLSKGLGRHMAGATPPEAGGQRKAGERVGWAVSRVALRLPWKPVCLPQAVATQWMLRRRGVPSTLYLGIDPRGGYDAHAWVRVGDRVVNGGPGTERYSVVSTFG